MTAPNADGKSSNVSLIFARRSYPRTLRTSHAIRKSGGANAGELWGYLRNEESFLFITFRRGGERNPGTNAE